MSTVCVFFVLFCVHAIVVAQTPTFFEQAESATDLYDNRGFIKGNTYDNFGNVMVSGLNGNVQYRYEFGSYPINGTPITLSLNYNQNASFSSILKYNKDASDGGQWVTLPQNRPVWIVGVNGFALNAIHVNPRGIQRFDVIDRDNDVVSTETIFTTEGGVTTSTDRKYFSDEDVTWVLDGYEAHNLQKDRTLASDSREPESIRLLREDGSLLVLTHKTKDGEDHIYEYNAEDAQIGLFVENSVNPKGYAVVEYDNSLFTVGYSDAVRLGGNAAENYYRPRKVTYYPGDGLAYIFYEWKTPFGIRPVTDLLYNGHPLASKNAGGRNCAPSTFYLYKIVQHGKTLLEIKRTKHSPYGDEVYTDMGVMRNDVQPGLALCSEVGEFLLNWADRSLDVDFHGNRTSVLFDKILLSGNAVTDDAAFPTMHFTDYGRDHQKSQLPEKIWDDEDLEYSSWLGLVSQIIDPAGRPVYFNYEPTKRVIKETQYPFQSTSGPTFDLDLNSQRLVSVEEPTVTVEIEYETAATQSYFPGSSVVLWGVPDKSMNQVANVVRVVDSKSNTALFEDLYAVPEWETSGTFHRYFNTKSTHKDLVANTMSVQQSQVKVVDIETIAPTRTKQSQTVWSSTCADNLVTETIVPYSTSLGITPPTEFDVLGAYKAIYSLPLAEYTNVYTVPSGTVPGPPSPSSPVSTANRIGKKEFVYEFEKVVGLPELTADGLYTIETVLAAHDQTMTDAFGYRVKTQTETFTSVENGTDKPQTKTVTSFGNFKRWTQTIGTAGKMWNKHASIANLLALIEDGTYTAEQAELLWHSGAPTLPFYVYYDDEIAVELKAFPQNNVVLKTEVFDAETPSLLLTGNVNSYYTSPTEITKSGQYLGNYLRINEQYVIPRGGTEANKILMSKINYDFALKGCQPVSSLNANGAKQYHWYGYYSIGSPTLLNQALVSGTPTQYNSKILTNESTVPVENYNFLPGSYFNIVFETPHTSVSEVRKASGAYSSTGQPSITTFNITESNKLNSTGTESEKVSANGWLTSLEHDEVGRLTLLQLPGDFSGPSTASGYDIYTESKGGKESIAGVLGHRSHITRGVPFYWDEPGPEYCNCVDTAEIAWPIYTFPYGAVAPEYGLVTFYEPPVPPCNYPPLLVGKSSEPQEAVNSRAGKKTEQMLSTTPTPFEPKYEEEDDGSYESKIHSHVVSRHEVIPYNLQNITSATLRFAVQDLPYQNMYVRYEVLTDYDMYDESSGTLIAPMDSVLVTQSLFAPSAPSTVRYFEKDITVTKSVLECGTCSSTDRLPVYVRFSTCSEKAKTHITNVTLDFEGTIRKGQKYDRSDFTLWFNRDEENQVITSLKKVDDANTITSPYIVAGEIPINLLYRHNASRVEYGANYLPERIVTKFPFTVNPTDPLIYNGTERSVTTAEYDGRGNATKTVDALLNETTSTTDANGRTVETILPAISSPAVSAAELNYGKMYTSVLSNNYQYVLVPTDITLDQPTFVGKTYLTQTFNKMEENTEGASDDPSDVKTSTKEYKDVLGRLRTKIEAISISPGTTGLTSLDLKTQYEYDKLGRVIKVVNPANQTTLYWYDDLGRVRYKYQPDIGGTSYAYDNVGNLRFSQNDEQRSLHKVSFYQYDDLNRPTVVGESRFSPTGYSQYSYATPNTQSLRTQATLPYNGQLNMGYLTDILNPNQLHTNLTPNELTVNRSMFSTYLGVFPFWTINYGVFQAPCVDIVSQAKSDRFSPALAPQTQVLYHPIVTPNLTNPTSTINNFENVNINPDNVVTTANYDELPPAKGTIWGNFPAATVWNSISGNREGVVRNLKGRTAAVAYRERHGQSFYYVVKSYDERGRVESQLRYTENLGYDAVYYKYNSQNSIIETRVVDPLRQHYTWYRYNDQGLVDEVRTHIENTGFGTGANPVLPTAVSPMTYSYLDPSALYSYTKRNEIENISYGISGVNESREYNSRGWLTKKLAEYIPAGMSTTLMSEDFYYNGFGQIVHIMELDAPIPVADEYIYDAMGRLRADRSNLADIRLFTYDNVGNRSMTKFANPNTDHNYAYKSLPATLGPNQLDKVTSFPVASPLYPYAYEQSYTYNLNGATLSRTTNTKNNTILTQVLETFGYNPAGLPITYTRKKAVGEGTDFGIECAPNAADNLASQWMYRYSPLQERETKRQTLHSGEITDGLAHVHYLLGADKQQLAVWNGLEKMPCTGNVGISWWPVEYNAYGPGNTRIITRPNGAAEFLITDHLGSTRLSIKANHLPTELTPTVYQDTKYYAFGDVRESDGQGARTGYIGREVDSESDLGSYGVRHYESATGRFLSTDVLWEKYTSWNPYQYSLNNPVTLLDDGGKHVKASDALAERGIKESVENNYEGVIKFVDGFVQPTEALQSAANEAGEGSNIYSLNELAKSKWTVYVSTAETYNYKQDGENKSEKWSDTDGKSYTEGNTEAGLTLTSDPSHTSGIKSVDGNIRIKVNPFLEHWNSNLGAKTAHELYGHALQYILWKKGETNGWQHGEEGVEDKAKDAETKATSTTTTGTETKK